MKKEALELVRRIFHLLKWDIPQGNLEEIFEASKNQASLCCDFWTDKHKERTEMYETLKEEIKKITFKEIYK